MENILDDEFVIQMDDSPPFSWIKQAPNRFMNCSAATKVSQLCVNAVGNAFEIGEMVRDVLGVESIEISDTFYPKSMDPECVPCIVSYSGQMKQAINAVESYERKGIVISSGGMIKNAARSRGWDYISLPKGYPSRFLFPELFGCLLAIKGKSVAIPDLESFLERNLPSEISANNESKLTALSLSKQSIAIMYDRHSYGLARRFKTLFLSNSGTKVDLVGNKDELSRTENKSSEVKLISFVSDLAIPGAIRIGGFPYDSTTLDGYVKNELIAELSSLYFGLLKGFEIELFDTQIE